MELIRDELLERSAVVANCAMNRDRKLTGSNGYGHELGVDVIAELRQRLRPGEGPVRWLDLCCGSGRALTEAVEQPGHAGFSDQAEIYGIDLVDYFAPAAPSATLKRITASVTTWEPPAGLRFDVITCVHGMHYVGDKLALLTRAAAWLTPDGVFAANFDAASIRRPDGTPTGRVLTTALRNTGFSYNPRTRRVIRHGGATDVALPFTYLGADGTAGPNYTGQPAVHSYYRPRRPTGCEEAVGPR